MQCLLIITSMQLQDKGHNSESYISELCPFQLNISSRMMAPDKRAFVPHTVLLFKFGTYHSLSL